MIRVLVVDDSATIREVFRQWLERDPEIRVVGTAADPYEARDLIVSLRPDVLTLDVEMPRMDGITFLRRLMAHLPLPVVVCSAATARGGARAIEAFEAGAVEVLAKPGGAATLAGIAEDLQRAVHAAARARLRRHVPEQEAALERPRPGPDPGPTVVAIGASTGGTLALEEVLRRLPPNAPPLLITQHMPAGFTAALAERLDRVGAVRVREASGAQPLTPGEAVVARGGAHLVLKGLPGAWRCEVREGPRVSGHCPSVDVMFASMAKVAGAHAIGVLLTGMGTDGARGLLQMRNAGAATLAQDARSSVVYGMPRAALEQGAVDRTTGLEGLADEILAAARADSRR